MTFTKRSIPQELADLIIDVFSANIPAPSSSFVPIQTTTTSCTTARIRTTPADVQPLNLQGMSAVDLIHELVPVGSSFRATLEKAQSISRKKKRFWVPGGKIGYLQLLKDIRLAQKELVEKGEYPFDISYPVSCRSEGNFGESASSFT